MNATPNRRILLVDDMAAIHGDFRKILAPETPGQPGFADLEAELFGLPADVPRLGFELDSAYQGQEALAMVTAASLAGRPYAMAFVDMRMPPGWDGVETIERLWQADEQLQVVICTAYSDHSWESVLSRLDMRDRLLILKKPFDAIEVSQLARALTAKWQRTGQLETTNLLLARKELEMRSVVEHMADAVLSFDDEGTIRSANSAAHRIFGYAEGKVIGADIAALVPALAKGDSAGMQGAGGVVVDPALPTSTPGRAKTGAAISLEISVSEYRLDDRRVRTAIVRDIGERLAMMRELVQAKQGAEQASLAKTQFVATVSHELRTPMNGVIGALGIVDQSPLSADQRKLITMASESAHALMEIVEDILDFSKIESGRLAIERQPLSVAAVIAQATRLVTGGAAGKGVALSSLVAADMPAAVWGDAARLRQVLVNLLGNAIKFSLRAGASRRVEVRARAVTSPTGAQLLELAVVDDGIGMDDATLARLFKPFSQADSTPTRRYGGTGLGLAIVRELVALMGGDIDVASAPLAGSTFTIRLPLEIAPAAIVGAEPEVEHVPVPTPPADATPARAVEAKHPSSILVAEDNPINQRVILAQLDLLGFQAEVAGDGRQALARLREGDFGLLITDLQMPEMDGFELATTLRREPGRLGCIPIIALTANALKGESERCAAAGMNEYLTKPVQLSGLQASVLRFLDGIGASTKLPGLVVAAPTADLSAHDQPVDTSVLPLLVGSDPAVLAEFFRDFVQSAGEAAAALATAAQAGRGSEVAFAAHRLKGSSRSIGAKRLGDRCAETEAAARSPDATVLAPSLSLLLDELTAVRAWLAKRYAPATTE